jgi:hypothetical protein
MTYGYFRIRLQRKRRETRLLFVNRGDGNRILRGNPEGQLLTGTPVMGSKRDFRCAIVHEGETRRSDEELGELMMRGTSATLCRDMLASERLKWWPER